YDRVALGSALDALVPIPVHEQAAEGTEQPWAGQHRHRYQPEHRHDQVQPDRPGPRRQHHHRHDQQAEQPGPRHAQRDGGGDDDAGDHRQLAYQRSPAEPGQVDRERQHQRHQRTELDVMGGGTGDPAEPAPILQRGRLGVELQPRDGDVVDHLELQYGLEDPDDRYRGGAPDQDAEHVVQAAPIRAAVRARQGGADEDNRVDQCPVGAV